MDIFVYNSLTDDIAIKKRPVIVVSNINISSEYVKVPRTNNIS